MNKKRLPIVLMALFCLGIIPNIAQATTITSCTFDKKPYYPGQTGFITVTIYNDKADKIRIAELTASIDYYYTDQIVYEQTFYSNATLPIEVAPSASATLYIPFSLPTNIAPGYTQLYVRARNEIWRNSTATWYTSEYPSYQPTLYIESPYRPQFQDLQAANAVTTILMYLLGITTAIFAVVVMFILIVRRRAEAVSQPAAAAAAA
ncbi:MAG TPA: hypothetical protein VMS95_02550 [Candidatus Krumholzibacteriaceae bacterium]|jgi:hypothetical protein|nr:hypothetical protein [Candidatus Krumholzibacteriaceae bacterium]